MVAESRNAAKSIRSNAKTPRDRTGVADCLIAVMRDGQIMATVEGEELDFRELEEFLDAHKYVRTLERRAIRKVVRFVLNLPLRRRVGFWSCCWSCCSITASLFLSGIFIRRNGCGNPYGQMQRRIEPFAYCRDIVLAVDEPLTHGVLMGRLKNGHREPITQTDAVGPETRLCRNGFPCCPEGYRSRPFDAVARQDWRW